MFLSALVLNITTNNLHKKYKDKIKNINIISTSKERGILNTNKSLYKIIINQKRVINKLKLNEQRLKYENYKLSHRSKMDS